MASMPSTTVDAAVRLSAATRNRVACRRWRCFLLSAQSMSAETRSKKLFSDEVTPGVSGVRPNRIRPG
jgi:hypothetical protein